MTARDSAGTVAESLARAVALLSEATLVLSRVAVQPSAGVPEPALGEPGIDYAVPARVLSVHARPASAGQPHQVAVWVQQIGPLPPPEPIRVWVTVAAGDAMPEEGQQCTLIVSLHPFL